ncbi:potassium transporter Trk [Microbacterium sp.]|uniref:potassium transporter Trk n=1 Tax=Microbacterium sp. TaxID=51671 RepID=UPI0039E551ED
MTAEHRIETARLRRSPRYAAFLLVGAGLGILVAVLLTFLFDGTAEPSATTGVEYSTSQVFGFVCLVCIPVGLALGGGVALVADRMLARRARNVLVDHERVTDPAE